MTHTPLTKAEREELRRMVADSGSDDATSEAPGWYCAGCHKMHTRCDCSELAWGDLPRLLADLDAAEAERDVFRAMNEDTSIQWAADRQCGRGHLAKAIAERDRAESELDAERKMRVEAEAALDERDCDVHARIRAGYDTTVADLWRAKVAEVEAERDAMQANWARQSSMTDEVRAERDALKVRLSTVSGLVADLQGKWATYKAGSEGIESERDALKAHLDDANENLAKSVVVLAKSNKARDDARKSLESLRNAINSFDGADSAREVKAPVGRAIGIIADQRAEIVALKAKLERCETNLRAANSDCAEADTRMAALKAKLAALANAAEVVAENYEECAGFGELDCLAPLYAAIAAARGGAS